MDYTVKKNLREESKTLREVMKKALIRIVIVVSIGWMDGRAHRRSLFEIGKARGGTPRLSAVCAAVCVTLA